jgi:hypothetical protein
VTVSSDTDVTSLTASYETSLNEHYRIVTGLSENQDYADGLTFSVSSLGGTYVSYYKVVTSRETSSGSSGGTEDTIIVTFRLIGATLSDGDIDLGDGDYKESNM